MNLHSKIVVALLAFFTASPCFAGKTEFSTSATQGAKGIMLAEGAKKKGASAGREKHIVREGRTKSKDSRNIDFDAVDIGGERKTPLGTLVNNNKLDKNYDFVKIRLRWHPEMVQSASSLDSGSSAR
jgi:hypothetical protein